MRGEYVYIMVSNDDLELIEAIADTPKELAKIVGYKPQTIHSECSWAKSGKRRSRFRKVCIKDLED